MSKISRAKLAGGLAQMEERLLCEHLLFKFKALSSNPRPKKERKKTGKH
jgi:hypothetical protein